MKRWNVLEYLRDEGEIAEFLESAILDIEEGEADVRFFFRCLTKATQARAINQIAKETGIDRKALCNLFLEDSADNADILRDKADSIMQAARAIAAPIVPIHA